MLTIVINAGGKSSRMGENKALKRFAGQVLIERVVSRLRPIAQEILVTTNQPQDFEFLGLPLIPDLIPGKGALGGLYTALASASHPLVGLVACDMPFANPRLFRKEQELMALQGLDVAIPRLPTGFEPLHAIYRRETCLDPIRAALAADALRMTGWFAGLKVYELSEEEIRAVDPELRSFINVNTPDEFRQAEHLDQESRL